MNNCKFSVGDLGEIIGYDNKNFPPQVHADWLIKVDTESNL